MNWNYIPNIYPIVIIQSVNCCLLIPVHNADWKESIFLFQNNLFSHLYVQQLIKNNK